MLVDLVLKSYLLIHLHYKELGFWGLNRKARCYGEVNMVSIHKQTDSCKCVRSMCLHA